MTTAHEPKSLARRAHDRFWECVLDGDFDTIRNELFEPAFQLHLPGQPGMPVEQAIAVASAWHAAFSEFGKHKVLDEVTEDSDGLRFAACVHDTMFHDGNFVVPNGDMFVPTYNNVQLTSIQIFRVTPEGKMRNWLVQFDTASLLAQLG